MEVEVNGKKYSAATKGARVARCYVCNDVVPKDRMMSIGPTVTPEMEEEDRLYIWRCEDCHAGSPKWLKHKMHDSSVGKYYRGILETPKDAESQYAIGRHLVEKRKQEVEGEIAKRLEAKTNGGSSRRVVAEGRKAGARAAVVVQKTRGAGVRSARVVRSRRKV